MVAAPTMVAMRVALVPFLVTALDVVAPFSVVSFTKGHVTVRSPVTCSL
jgi:hypothetical protein